MTDGRDYSDILRSPYDPDPEDTSRREGTSDLPWLPAVLAAVIGALVASAFVVFAVVTGPDAEAEEVVSTTVTTVPTSPEQSSDVPPGFVAVTDEVGVDVVSVNVSSEATAIAVATAVTGGTDPATVEPLDVAFWVLANGGTDHAMVRQYGQRGALGSSTIEFPPLPAIEEPALTPWLATGPFSESIVFELDSMVPQTLTSERLEVGDAVIVIDELAIGDGWGWVAWSVEEGTVAKVDTVITFIDTDDPETEEVDPTTLTPAHLRRIAQGSGSRSLPPMYGYAGADQLVRSGEPLGSANTPTSIEVEFRVTVPLGIVEAVPLELPPIS